MDAAEGRRRWQLVLPHRTYLVRIAVSRGMSRDDAEDCAQEAMVRAVGFAGLDDARVVEFLASTTMRLAVDRHRTHARDARVALKLLPWYADEPSPEEATCDRGEATWVAAHVASLPESQRAALTAKADGLSCQEIAARMGLSYKAVESLLSRARAYVRAAVASAWVLLFRAQRRGGDVPHTVPAMALVALMTAGVLAPDRPVAPPPVTESAATPAGSLAGVTRAAPAARAARARVPARPVAARPAPPPPASDRGPGRPPFIPPLPAALPADPCDARLPHVDTCLHLESYQPGEALQDCLDHGVQVSTRGVECASS